MNAQLVRDVMTKDVVTVRSFAPFREIAQAMLAHDVGALPVVDSMGHAIGIVSRTDLIAKEAVPDTGGAALWQALSPEGRKTQARQEATSAARLMSVKLVTVHPDAGITRAAYLMRRHEVTHLPVVDENNLVVGIVSRADLLRVFMRDDAEIREDVVRDVLIGALDAERGAVEIRVEDGVVTLEGAFDHASTAAHAVRATRAVPGVVDVVDKLAWTVDDSTTGSLGRPGPLF
jgi:CBS domain-containing protein